MKIETGLSLTSLLFIVFVVLKLTNHIDWSWWWITAPLWGPFGLVVGGIVLIGLGVGLVQLIRALVAIFMKKK